MQSTRRALGILLLALLLAACRSAPPGEDGRTVTLTLSAIGSQDRGISQPPAYGAATATPLVVTPVPRPSFGPPPTATSPGAGFPGEPPEAQGFVIDRSSAAFASERRTIADDYASLRLERPFTQETMEYQPFVDILRSEIAAEGEWMYVSIFLEDDAPPGAQVMYALELDLDRDGRGDWLIVAAAPLGSTWTHDGLRVLQDANRDVGGSSPLAPDSPQPQGDGYETVAFGPRDQASTNPAWARRPPGPSARVQIALSLDWLGNEPRLLWGVWADAGLQDPSLFEYNDQFTVREAGSPLSTSPDYPLNGLASVDNTCRWVFGFAPRGVEPGLCAFQPPTPFPSATPIPAPPTP